MRHITKGGLIVESGWGEGRFPYEDDKPITIPMQQCVHCGFTFPAPRFQRLITRFVTPEQAKILQIHGETIRGFCYRCSGPICGPQCLECVSIEEQLDNIEAGRDALTKKISVSVGGVVLGG